MVTRRAHLLEFAVLGLLHDAPAHGYELRRQLNEALGSFRALSYGTLYPALRSLLTQGLIRQDEGSVTTPGRRPRIVYALTETGQSRFSELAAAADASAWEDDDFDVRVHFFARTEREVRLRILEGRRQRLEEKARRADRRRARADPWSTALHDREADSLDHEMRWLTRLIDAEHHTPGERGPGEPARRAATTDAPTPPDPGSAETTR